MGKDFEVIDFQQTPLGDLMLRRRTVATLGGLEVFEVKLGDEFLMTSLFHDVEVALADFALAELDGTALDVVVGGLGLGYTALAALKDARVRSLAVVEALKPVIDWHNQGRVPLASQLVGDPRCRFVHGDFFGLAAVPGAGFDPECPGQRFHAVLLDIDHSPRHLLHPRHAAFYEPDGLRQFAAHMQPRGVFGLWSDDPPDPDFLRNLGHVFISSRAQVVKFYNPLQGRDSASTVYIARVE
ncbi:MAG TPA: spermidine synthase [Verrucomicrobiae bacterium]|nr:spermidine synthase [Verrucomicrobiae bacterium]